MADEAKSSAAPVDSAAQDVSTDAPKGEQGADVPAVTIDSLATLLDELNPFLDTSGWAYAYLPHEDAEKRLTLRMDDRRVRCLLFTLYRERHGKLPTWGQIHKAMALVQGRLLKDRKGPKPRVNDPTMQLFLKAAAEHEGWAGSAKEVLDLLRATQKAHKVVKDTHLLPDSATAMGIWLADNQLRLSAYGIELYRPTRRSTKRLWAWRRITEYRDTSDTSETPASALASAITPKEDNKNLKSDTRDTGNNDLTSNLQTAE